jgi:response regulator RpfG family c-di-GMP phosphodiesterase
MPKQWQEIIPMMDKIIFAKPNIEEKKPTDSGPNTHKKETWKVIISDDEQQVHEITKLALKHFVFADRELEFISAYTGEETIQAISKNPDTAILLQDVVMESDHAGLKVIKTIREDLKNISVRIILRTGQPGQAPERQVIEDYDINDYKEKTELTSQKLFTLMYSSLRSFRDILALERNKNGLKKIINSTAEIFARQSVEKFLCATLEQLTSLLYKDEDAFICDASRMLIKKHHAKIKIVSAIGEYIDFIGHDAVEVLDSETIQLLNQSLTSKKNIYRPGFYVAYFASYSGDEHLLCFSGPFKLSELDQHLVDMYIKHASISFDNLTLYQKVEKGQQEIVNILATSIETRSKETGNHINRVAEFSVILAKKAGLSPEEIETLKFASPLHDFGKIAIPDLILNKPGKLDADEWMTMKTHAAIGYDLLIQSKDEFLQIGALISNEHHEKWDGSGYPAGKKGQEIHVLGRITAVADVFDALASERCYKKAWPLEDILSYFKEQRGKHFEPLLVDILFDNLEQFTKVLEVYKD